METESSGSTARSLGWAAMVLVIIGALNWLIIGIFGFNVIGTIFGGVLAPISRIVYIVVGISGAYLIYFAGRLLPHTSEGRMTPPRQPAT